MDTNGRYNVDSDHSTVVWPEWAEKLPKKLVKAENGWQMWKLGTCHEFATTPIPEDHILGVFYPVENGQIVTDLLRKNQIFTQFYGYQPYWEIGSTVYFKVNDREYPGQIYRYHPKYRKYSVKIDAKEIKATGLPWPVEESPGNGEFVAYYWCGDFMIVPEYSIAGERIEF